MEKIIEILQELKSKNNLKNLAKIDLKNNYEEYTILKNEYTNLYNVFNNVKTTYNGTLEKVNNIIKNLKANNIKNNDLVINNLKNTLNKINSNKKQKNIKIKNLTNNINSTKNSIIKKLEKSKEAYGEVISSIKGLCGQLKNASERYKILKNSYSKNNLKIEPFSSILTTINTQTRELNTQLKNNSCKKVFNLFTNNNSKVNYIQATSGNKSNSISTRLKKLRNLYIKNNAPISQKNKYRLEFLNLLTNDMLKVKNNETNKITQLKAKKQLIIKLMNEMEIGNNNRKYILGNNFNTFTNNNKLPEVLNRFVNTLLPPPQQAFQMPLSASTSN